MPSPQSPEEKKIPRKKFILPTTLAALALILCQGVLHLRLYRPALKGLSQMVALFAVLTGAAAIFLFYRLLRKRLRAAAVKAWNGTMGRVISRLAGSFERAARKLRRRFGRREGRERMRDERRFVFSNGREREEKRKKDLTKRRFRDLGDDKERVRYLYIRLIRREVKKGKRFRLSDTPQQLGARWKLSEEEGSRLFPVYTDARFGGEDFSADREELEKWSEQLGVRK